MNNKKPVKDFHFSCGITFTGFIVIVLLLWAIWFGLPIGDKTWNIDIFPPRIWEIPK